MIVLGISDNHGSGAALVRDGEIVAAVNQERLNREKNTLAFPWEAIGEVLRIGGVRPENVDLIVAGSEFTPVFLLRVLKGMHQKAKRYASQFSYLFDLYIVYQVIVAAVRPLRMLETALSRWFFRRRIASSPNFSLILSKAWWSFSFFSE